MRDPRAVCREDSLDRIARSSERQRRCRIRGHARRRDDTDASLRRRARCAGVGIQEVVVPTIAIHEVLLVVTGRRDSGVLERE